MMNAWVKTIFAFGAGIAAGIAVHVTSLRGIIFNIIKNSVGSSSSIVQTCEAYPWIISAGIGVIFALAVFVAGLSVKRSDSASSTIYCMGLRLWTRGRQVPVSMLIWGLA